jgi:hypothetical protein
MEKKRELVRRTDVDVDEIAGTVLTHLSGMSARCSRDMVVRRNIDVVVTQIRTEIPLLGEVKLVRRVPVGQITSTCVTL